MPRVKIDYIVSFSSEDPEHPAANLLSREVGPRWLAGAAGPASAVLQLAKAAEISSITIGAQQAALVEVLAGRSESPAAPFQVLVPSSVFLSPRESRAGAAAGGAGGARVRSFERAALHPAARAQRWDRLRIVVSQPYNKHCKFGISFVHIFEPESGAPPAPLPAPAAPPAVLPPPAPAPTPLAVPSEDEEEDFRPGELFAQHRAQNADTGAQIRKATSQALRSDSEAPKLIKTQTPRRGRGGASPRPPPRARDAPRDSPALLYEPEDERPDHRIDRVLQQHNDTKKQLANNKDRTKHENTEAENQKRSNKRDGSNHGETTADKPKESNRQDGSEHDASTSAEKRDDRSDTSKRKRDSPREPRGGDDGPGRRDDRRRNGENGGSAASCAEGGGGGGGGVLAGVQFVLSGYEHPRRGAVRALAERLGARARRDWGPGCTHLICAFPRTPKLVSLRAAGSAAPAVRAEWLDACAAAGRRLPWRRYATEPARRSDRPDSPDPVRRPDSECDTDDEIEAVLRRRKRPRGDSGDSPAGAVDDSGDSPAGAVDNDVLFVRDERMQGNVTVEESEADSDSADTEPESPAAGRGAGRGALPALLAGRAVLAAGPRARLLRRYVRAYGGHVLTAEQAETRSEPYIRLVTEAEARPGPARAVRADWLWAVHAARRALPPEDYLVIATK